MATHNRVRKKKAPAGPVGLHPLVTEPLKAWGGYTALDLMIIVLAGAYELFDEPLAQDSVYDRLCQEHATSGHCHIPGFDVSTGQWVHDIMTPKLQALIQDAVEEALENCKKRERDLNRTWLWKRIGANYA